MVRFPHKIDCRFSDAQQRALELVAERFDTDTSDALRMLVTASASAVPWLVEQLAEEGTPIVTVDPLDYIASKVRAGEAVIA